MQELDCVELTAEKKKYAADGVHKGMQGVICYDKCCNGFWLVEFPQLGEKPDIAIISVLEEDLKLIPRMDAAKNEQIKALFVE